MKMTYLAALVSFSLSAQTYSAVQFADPWATSNTPYALSSSDGITWASSTINYAAAASLGWGNPSLYRQGPGAWFLTHEVPLDANMSTTGMGVASSPDGINYTLVGRIANVPGQGGWFIDSDGPHVIGFEVNSSHTVYHIAESHPLNAAMTSWSVAAQLTGDGTGSPPVQNPFITKIGSTYYLWSVTPGGNAWYSLATASSLLGPYAYLYTGNWAGWGGTESINIIQLPDSPHHWRAYFKRLGYSGMYYSESLNDMDGPWSTETHLSSPVTGGNAMGVVVYYQNSIWSGTISGVMQ